MEKRGRRLDSPTLGKQKPGMTCAEVGISCKRIELQAYVFLSRYRCENATLFYEVCMRVKSINLSYLSGKKRSPVIMKIVMISRKKVKKW